jgi:hypothetical protein
MKTIIYELTSGFRCINFHSKKTSNNYYIAKDLSYILTSNQFLSGGLTNGGTVSLKWIDNIILKGPAFFTKDCQ